MYLRPLAWARSFEAARARVSVQVHTHVFAYRATGFSNDSKRMHIRGVVIRVRMCVAVGLPERAQPAVWFAVPPVITP